MHKLLFVLDKILSRDMFLNYTLFYLVYKYKFYSNEIGRKFTYIYFLYAILIFLYDFYKKKFKFSGMIFSYLMCISFIISCMFSSQPFNIDNIKGFSIYFVNFFMLLPMFYGKDTKDIVKIFEKIFFVIIIFSFFNNLVGIIFYLLNITITYAGQVFGPYAGRFVSARETANETGLFANIAIFSSIYFLFLKNYLTDNKNKIYINVFLCINIIIQIITLIFSKNRSNYIGCFGGLVVVVLIYNLYFKKYKLLKFSIFVLAVGVIIILTYLFIRIKNGLGSDTVRFDLYVFSFLSIKYMKNIFLGFGYSDYSIIQIENFDNIFNSFPFQTAKGYLYVLVHDGNAHNMFCQQFLYAGIFGLIILTLFILNPLLIIVYFLFNIHKLDINLDDFKLILILIYFVLFGTFVGSIEWTVIGTMTCFVNLMYFISISGIFNIYNKYKIKKIIC